jgi:Ca-activated chloride channel family protein
MRIRTFAIWAALCVVASSAGAMAVPLPSAKGDPGVAGIWVDPGTALAQGELSHFSAGGTLVVDGRLGHASLARATRGATGETFLFTSVTASDPPGAVAPPMHLALVIDRSGSMAGAKLANAIAAAVTAVERMRDGDTVSVVSFDDKARVVVPPTNVTAASRPGIEASVRGIRLGGETCISCGLEEAMTELDGAALGHDEVDRVLLISDGEATVGVKDGPGLRSIASRMRDRGMTISTIGVDLNFDEKVMAAIAQEGNGRHYFVANASALPGVFTQEFDALAALVASDAGLSVELAPGVEVEEVFDRSFRREGARVVVPFGTFSAKQEKTVLMRLRVPAGQDGVQPVARVGLAYRDLGRHADGHCDGDLALVVTSDGTEQRDIDPFVAGRLERARTVRALTDANKLFEQGKVDEARASLAHRQQQLAKTESTALAASRLAPKPAAASVSLADEFESQKAAIATAQSGFANASVTTPLAGTAAPPPSPQAKGALKANQANASDMGF